MCGLGREAVAVKKASSGKHLVFDSQHFHVALHNFQCVHALLAFRLSSLRISIKEAYF